MLRQVLTLGAAHALSRAQRRELESTRDAEEEGWGWSARMQQPLIKASCVFAICCSAPGRAIELAVVWHESYRLVTYFSPDVPRPICCIMLSVTHNRFDEALDISLVWRRCRSSQLSIESGLSSATGLQSTPSQNNTQNSSTWASRLQEKYGIGPSGD